MCSQSYFSDSYGRGIEAGFKGGNLRPALVDEGCYLLGIEKAQLTLKEARMHSIAFCQKDFNEGYREGLKASLLSSGNICYVDGYSAGLAALDVGAREGNTSRVGQSCVREYQRGFKAGRASAPIEPELDQKLANCYQVGHFDGSYLPGRY